MNTYTTIQGDMWDTVAYKTLGDERYLHLLIEANSRYRDYYIFPAGIVLSVPHVENRRMVEGLPPWKRGME